VLFVTKGDVEYKGDCGGSEQVQPEIVSFEAEKFLRSCNTTHVFYPFVPRLTLAETTQTIDTDVAATVQKPIYVGKGRSDNLIQR